MEVTVSVSVLVDAISESAARDQVGPVLTPNEDFVIERFGPIVVGAGFSGHGFKFTPLIGARLADLALARGQ